MIIDSSFKPIPGFPRYFINENGKVVSLVDETRPRVLKNYQIIPRKEHYPPAAIVAIGGTSKPVSLLVMLAHGPERPSHKHSVWHLDKNPLNHHISNLVWMTRKEIRANQNYSEENEMIKREKLRANWANESVKKAIVEKRLKTRQENNRLRLIKLAEEGATKEDD